MAETLEKEPGYLTKADLLDFEIKIVKAIHDLELKIKESELNVIRYIDSRLFNATNQGLIVIGLVISLWSGAILWAVMNIVPRTN
jgi:hypothetical protein